MALNHACLPIPAPAQLLGYYNRLFSNVKQGFIFTNWEKVKCRSF